MIFPIKEMGDEAERVKAQERNLDALVRNNGFLFTEAFFPLASGQIGPYYVESTVVEKKGADYKMACDDVADLVQRYNFMLNQFEVISGGESRDWDFSNVVAYILRKPHAKIYKNGKILGADLEGKTVAHVADLNNEGSSPRDYWIPAIQKAGGIIKDIFFYVDRMEDGVQVMEGLGLRSHSVVPLDEHAWEYLRGGGVISSRVYNSLRARMEDKDAWAKKMLFSDEGLRVLGGLFTGSDKDREKAHKILERGYPEIDLEIRERLREMGFEIGVA